jgi:transcriptional regulator GlxA family with amidase domain
MNYYLREVQRISSEKYSKEYLTNQLIASKRFMDEQFGKDVNLDTFAAKACMSRFHFLRVFKTYYGVTPGQYLTSVRVREAKRLLKANKSILEVCMALGFDSLPSFTALFKRNTGSTPALFQKKTQKSNIR